MIIPPELFKLIDRQNNGNPNISLSDRVVICDKMTKLFGRYKNMSQKLHHLLNVSWEEDGVEDHYKSKLWYSSHRKLRHYEDTITDIHKQMFQLLTSSDGVSSQFVEGHVWSAQEIYESCIKKYSHP